MLALRVALPCSVVAVPMYVYPVVADRRVDLSVENIRSTPQPRADRAVRRYEFLLLSVLSLSIRKELIF